MVDRLSIQNGGFLLRKPTESIGEWTAKSKERERKGRGKVLLTATTGGRKEEEEKPYPSLDLRETVGARFAPVVELAGGWLMQMEYCKRKATGSALFSVAIIHFVANLGSHSLNCERCSLVR